MFFVLLLVIVVVVVFFLLGQKIPKIIHQTAPTNKTWPESWIKCQESWKTLHPDFEYRFWSDEDIDQYMKKSYPDFYHNVYTKYDKHIKRVDAVRYFILRDYGGIYADMDFMCLKRFFEELPSNKVSISMSNHENELYQNALMISPKGHPFWDKVIATMTERANTVEDIFDATGPRLIDSCVAMDASSVNTLSLDTYNPIRVDENTRAVHLETGTWYR